MILSYLPGRIRAFRAAVVALLGLLSLTAGVAARPAGAAAASAQVTLAGTVPRPAVATSPVRSAPPEEPDGGWRWPLAGVPEVVRAFDPPDTPYGPGHRGVDLAAAAGSAVLSAGPGVVAWAGVLAGRGVVSVLHPGGLRTTYEPVETSVAAGRTVRAGDRLGLLVAGHPGCSRPACLHWGLRRGMVYLDPMLLLRRGPVRLLPLTQPVPAVIDTGGAAPSTERSTAGSTGAPAGHHPLVSPTTTTAACCTALLWAIWLNRRRPP